MQHGPDVLECRAMVVDCFDQTRGPDFAAQWTLNSEGRDVIVSLRLEEKYVCVYVYDRESVR